MTLKKGQKIIDCTSDIEARYPDTKGCRKLKIPASGQQLGTGDSKIEQLKIDG